MRAHAYPFIGPLGDLIGHYIDMRTAMREQLRDRLLYVGEDIDDERFENALSAVGLARVFRPLVRDAVCVECGGAVAWMYAHLVGTPACMCFTCAEKKRVAREAKEKDGGDEGRRWFARRAALSQIPAEALSDLGITPEEPSPKLKRPNDGRWKVAAVAVHRYMSAPRQRTLVLAGQSGVGKTRCSQWAVWRSLGLFLGRNEWTSLPVRREDDSRMRWVINHGGVVVLDNALDVRPGGEPADSEWEQEVVFQVAQTRHDEGRATLITTQAEKDEVRRAYGTHGEALIRRAEEGHDLAGAPHTGGWVRCVWHRKGEEVEAR